MYVETRLGRWFYDESGERRAEDDASIVLLHSLLCDGGMWRGQVGPLSQLGRVVVIDSPGHGRSDVPPPFTLDDHARAMTDALDALRIPRALLVGLSWGGMVSMRLSLLRPELVAAMVLLDTSADGTLLRERIEYRLLIEVSRRIGLPPKLVRSKIVPLMFSEGARHRQPALIDEFVRSVGGYPREGTARATMAVSIDRPSILEAIRQVRTPTLVGYGEEDTATPGDHSRRIAARIGGAKLVTFPKAGHLSALEAPSLVNAHVVPFVKEHIGAA
jgi:3-oxoadipate enol-lactonase